MTTPGKNARAAGQTRRRFTATCIALAAGSAGVSGEASNSRRWESLRFRSREESHAAAADVRARFPNVILLEAIAAPHVPELLILHGSHLGRSGVYEVRRYSGGAPACPLPAYAELSQCEQHLHIFRHRSLSERAAQGSAVDLSPAPDEIGFYRVI